VTAARLDRRPRAALVHTFHGHLLHGYFSPAVTRAVVVTERTLAARTDRLVAVGARVRDELLAAGVGRRRRWEVVAPGIELGPVPERVVARASLGLDPGVPVVAFVARLTAVKRPDRFAAVAALVAERHPQVVFLVAGDGDGAPAARAAASAADIESVYAAADVVLLTSDNEGMPVSLIEAALAGRPAVTPDVGSAAEVVLDGVTGLVTPPGDARALAAAVDRLLGDDTLRASLGREARVRADERFSAARLVADTERIYADLARERGWA
jgi:glycosyltransferase involved in cell wall biosynthesis